MTAPLQQPSELISEPLGGVSAWDNTPESEPAAIAAIVRAIAARVRAAAAGGVAHRDAHPKAHGCVEAQFQVLENLPDAMRKGLFRTPASYRAWVRFSNGSETAQPDAVGDGRGMAIKVLGVVDSPSATQDFVMINAPAFFVRDAADYVEFQAAANPLRFFFPGWNPFQFRLHELAMARAITAQVVSNQLNVSYFSMTPYLFEDQACKYSARPVGPPSPFQDRTDPNFLRENLAASLAHTEAAFDLCVQLRSRPETMPIEDPTVVWSETEAPFIPVARLTIPAQSFDTPARDAFGENLSFTPWHGLDSHRPLGGINRVRRRVYETISDLRHQLNGVARAEP